MATAPDARPAPAPIRVRPLRAGEREAALDRLHGRARDDLFLIDVVRQLGTANDAEAEVLGAWRGGALVGVASLRPTVVLETGLDPAPLAALAAAAASMGSAGLVRTGAREAAPLWERLAARGRQALVDRIERALVLVPGELRPAEPGAGTVVRAAEPGDLEPLVEAARASLREEGRPDPFLGDPRGFRRWVAARLGRARVGVRDGHVAWVGYADVRLPEGWLLQGVYTWPADRRQGLAAAGVTALCRQAFAAGAEHVQLSVVEGNRPALALYERLGFRPQGSLRTVLFA